MLGRKGRTWEVPLYGAIMVAIGGYFGYQFGDAPDSSEINSTKPSQVELRVLYLEKNVLQS